MLTEDYVSFEIAKLLREKGFNERCFSFYWPDGSLDANSHDKTTDLRNSKTSTAVAPTLQMTMKWLREVHNIYIVVHPYTDKKGQSWGFIFDKYTYGCWQELGIYITDSWNSYEEACNAAIKYVLKNLI